MDTIFCGRCKLDAALMGKDNEEDILKLVTEIVKCAKVTARLYALQLEEIGNF